MIVGAKNQQEWQALAQFLHLYAHVQPSADLKMIGWVRGGELSMVVGFNGFVGKVAQIHVGMLSDFHYTPKAMLREVFGYAFNLAERKLLLGIVSSKNLDAIRYNEHLGFNELWRLPDMHEDNGDIIVMGMYKHECRYLVPNHTKVSRMHSSMALAF